MSLSEAKLYAIEWSGREDINVCRETKDAYIFDVDGELSIGGPLPVVILKESMEARTMTQYVDDSEDGIINIIKEHKLA